MSSKSQFLSQEAWTSSDFRNVNSQLRCFCPFEPILQNPFSDGEWYFEAEISTKHCLNKVYLNILFANEFEDMPSSYLPPNANDAL